MASDEDTMVRLKNISGSDYFHISLDVQNWSQVGTFYYTIRVSLVDYPEIESMEQSFAVLVAPENVSVPPLVIEEDGPKYIVHAKEEAPIVIEKEEQDILADEIRVQAKPISQDGPRPVFKTVTQTGLVELTFTRILSKISDDIDLKTLKYEAEPGVLRPVLVIGVEPSL